jgi:Fungal N-terminal domain of STAND proteins
VTADLLREYKAMIGTTTSDLEDILQDLDARMREPNFESAGIPDQAIVDRSDSREERASIQQCLNICVQVSAHIDQSLADVAIPSANDGGAIVVDKSTLARLITSETLQDCKRGLGLTTFELRARLREAERRLANALRHERESDGGVQDHQRMREDLDSVKQCLSICAEAAEEAATERVNVFEDVSMSDDGHQLIISTMGDLISAKRVTVGSRSAQWLGQMSDATVQQLSQDHSYQNATPDEQAQVTTGTRFENRHGTGRKLALNRPTNTALPTNTVV